MTDKTSLPYAFDPSEPRPAWDEAGRVHDWRNHVGEGVRDLWPTFTPEQRVALALDADERASNEEWD